MNKSILGGMSPQRFLRDYWHKQPLLIRQAFPSFQAPLSREQLFELAARNDVESRLVSHARDRWEMQGGPFDRLPPVSQKAWTLLVQGVNLHHVAADALLQQFRFVPDARLDDLMISYASDGGGVGPHFDSYDVFLLQAHGRRRWRIGAQDDLSLTEGLPLKILKNFQPQQEFILEPGDMLYLPPHLAHDGVALGECMTYSIGFRAPSWQELAEGFLQFMAESIELPGRYADPDLRPARRPAELDAAMIARVEAQLRKIRFGKQDVALFLGEYLSEPKPTVYFESPARQLSPARFLQMAGKRGLALSRKTRMLYRGKHVFVNGESFIAEADDRTLLAALANRRELDGMQVQQASKDLIETLHCWHEDGWLELR